MTSKSNTPLPEASLLRRFAAWIYDLFLIFAVSFAYVAIFAFIASALGIEPNNLELIEDGENMTLVGDENFQPAYSGIFFQAGLILVNMLFYIGFWIKKGATLGMQTWRIEIVDQCGNRPNLKTCIFRCIAAFLSFAFFGLGYFWSLIDKNNRTAHDILTNTRMLVHPKN